MKPNPKLIKRFMKLAQRSCLYSILIGIAYLGFGHFESKAITFCNIKDVGNFNPAATVENRADISWSRLIFERLVEFDRTNESLVPSLATGWEISNSGKTYRFTLREGVQFHDSPYFNPTRNFNADDVIFTFTRLFDSNHPLHALHGENYDDFLGSTFSNNLKAVRKIDDLTVEIDLVRPDSNLIPLLAQDFSSILSAEYGKQMIDTQQGDKFDLFPIGTGPYRMTKYYPDTLINLRKFENTWIEMPLEQNILLVPYPSEEERINKLIHNECDIIPSVSIANLPKLEADPQISVLQKEDNSILYIAYNTQWSPMNITKVRRAMTMSVNKNVIAQAVFKGRAAIAITPVPPVVWGSNKDIGDFAFSTTTARELFNEVGSFNFSFSLWLPDTPSIFLPDPTLLGEILRADWVLAGVNVDLKYVDAETLAAIAADPNRAGAVIQVDTSNSGSPDDYLNKLLRCKSRPSDNAAHWCNELFERIVDAAANEDNLETRKEYYGRAQEIFRDELPWTPLVNHFIYVPIRKNITNFKINSYQIYDLLGVSKAK